MLANAKAPNMKNPHLGQSFAMLIVSALVLVSFSGCKKSNSFVPPPPPQVEVSHPLVAPVTPFLEFTGNTQAYRTVELQARVEGYLDKVLLHEGDVVKEGQLLFQIQQDTYQAKLQQAEAELLADKAKLMHAETEFHRFSGLLKENAAPQTEVDRWHYERDAAKAGVMSAEANVTLAKLNLSYTRVTAPFNGVAGRRMKDPGNLVGAGEKTTLSEVNQIDPIYVYFSISEQDLLSVQSHRDDSPRDMSKGRVPQIPVSLGLADEEGFPHEGVLDFAGIRVDSTTGTLLLRAIFPNPNFRILPGLYARVRASVAAPRPELLLPQETISYDQLGSYVLTVDDKNIVERKSVKTGMHKDKMMAILEGVSESDWVVVNGLLSAIPGKVVSTTQQPIKGTENTGKTDPASDVSVKP
jgi:RND family efflux transporter MFP subunit